MYTQTSKIGSDIYIYIILDTYHPETLYLREQGCEDPLLFFEATKWSASKKVWETLVYCVLAY